MPALALLLAGLSAAAGAIHLALVPAHAGGSLLDPLAFALAGWAQLSVAGVVLAGHAGRALYAASIAVNLSLVGLWVWSRTAGLPLGAHAGVAEQAGAVDLTVVALEMAAVVVAAVALFAPRLRLPVAGGAAAGFAALAVATVVMVSPDAASHGDHDHGDAADHVDAAAEMAAVDAARCDLVFNPAGYWTEAAAAGVDTHGGGVVAGHDHAETGSLATQLAQPAPLGGRGSEHLDRLVSLSSQATSETAAGAVVAELAKATDEEYAAWLAWLRANQGGHDHASAAPGDQAGHGGHLGPQAWQALLDSDACETLAAELELARATALRYPTAADAEAAGWVKVTPYLPGIAAHYMNFGLVDGRFAVDEPEMLLYDGNGPDAHVVGLSYFIRLDGEAEPSQGFTGPNDHYHRHVGLCVRDGLVIGDTTTTEEECAALGGNKGQRRNGWMSHAWVVPGCESPWGVFSAANPVLDVTLASASDAGTGTPGCASSTARNRYDLGPGQAPSASAASLAGSTPATTATAPN